jgi:hypothetical protein
MASRAADKKAYNQRPLTDLADLAAYKDARMHIEAMP